MITTNAQHDVDGHDPAAHRPGSMSKALPRPKGDERYRYRVRFAKTGTLRFISHNDLMRTWERMLRRTGLPVRYTEGFHTKLKVSSPLSLAVGVEGLDEIFGFELLKDIPASDVQERMSAECVPGLSIIRVEELSPNTPRGKVVAVEYTCVLHGGIKESDLLARSARLLAEPHWVIERRIPGKPAKSIDIRPKIETLGIRENVITMRLHVDNGATLRPQEVLSALGLDESIHAGEVDVARSRVELGTD